MGCADPRLLIFEKTMTILKIMSHDHGECDDHFYRLETCIAEKDWACCEEASKRFVEAMERHFNIEENILFPAFEQASGMTGGPTQMMRMEHTQMRQLFEELLEATSNANGSELTGVWETLLIMMQQHNMKEESMLYPMIDNAVGEKCLEQVRQELAGAA